MARFIRMARVGMKLKDIYLRQQSHPGFLGIFINPFYFARKGLMGAIVSFAPRVRGRVLDVGCGQKPYEHLFSTTQYIGLEMDTSENRAMKKADFFYDGKNFPFENEYFDSIICNQVLEHVFNPDNFLSETNRVLKLDGTLILTAPFIWDEHEQPYDYARYSSFGLSYLLKEYGFEVIELKKTQADVSLIFQLINAYLYKITVTQNPYINLLTTVFLMSPFNILGLLLSRLCPSNEDLYLDNVVLAKKTNASREMSQKCLISRAAEDLGGMSI